MRRPSPHQDPQACSAGVVSVDGDRKAHPQLIQTQRWTDLWSNEGVWNKMICPTNDAVVGSVSRSMIGCSAQNAGPVYNLTK